MRVYIFAPLSRRDDRSPDGHYVARGAESDLWRFDGRL
jgi:hypothetical protein